MITVGTKPQGFTLIEILVVIIVLGLLAALVGPRILGRVSEAKSATARTQIELLGVALDNYRLDNGRSEEHTSELQSRLHLVCRLLLEKKKKKKQHNANVDIII